MKIINLFENTEGRPGCSPQHGLSFYIETKKHKILMDTGQSDLLIGNAQTCGVDLTAVDTVVISHGHYDHAGGLLPFLAINPDVKIYIREGADRSFYNVGPDGTEEKYIGMDPKIPSLEQVIWCGDEVKIDDELSLFSNLSGTQDCPPGNTRLAVKAGDALVPDDFSHEQCLVVKQDGKKILFSGCAHSGILNILDRFMELYGTAPNVVISGFHLMKKDGSYDKEDVMEILTLAHKLKKTKTIYYTCHCTGEKPYEIMKRVMGKKIKYVHCGETIDLTEKKKRRHSYMKWHKFFAWGTVVCFVMTMVTGYKKL